MLFSEPKIPQPKHARVRQILRERFSALQRAENSSTGTRRAGMSVQRSFSALQRAENSSTHYLDLVPRELREFQCSSASRKFLNPSMSIETPVPTDGFSALQRAENSSTTPPITYRPRFRFQCSSASRKFLNSVTLLGVETTSTFQCSSASRKFLNQVPHAPGGCQKAFQCSSASRKFLNQSESRSANR